jgi:FAD synthetase
MVFGTFDIFHKGHENLFKQAKNYGDQLIVLVARDETVKKIKGKPPVNDEITRYGILKQFASGDRIILGSRTDMYKRIKDIRPDVIALGYDQTAFTDELEEKIQLFGLKAKIVRLKPFKPELYKSSKLNKK